MQVMMGAGGKACSAQEHVAGQRWKVDVAVGRNCGQHGKKMVGLSLCMVVRVESLLSHGVAASVAACLVLVAQQGGCAAVGSLLPLLAAGSGVTGQLLLCSAGQLTEMKEGKAGGSSGGLAAAGGQELVAAWWLAAAKWRRAAAAWCTWLQGMLRHGRFGQRQEVAAGMVGSSAALLGACGLAAYDGFHGSGQEESLGWQRQQLAGLASEAWWTAGGAAALLSWVELLRQQGGCSDGGRRWCCRWRMGGSFGEDEGTVHGCNLGQFGPSNGPPIGPKIGPRMGLVWAMKLD